MDDPTIQTLARFAWLAYRKIGESELSWADRINDHLSRESYILIESFDRNGTQGFIARRHDADVFVVSFRGTEQTSYKDIRADLQFFPVKDRVGWVHSGFSSALNEVWDQILLSFFDGQDGSSRIWFVGHSMGGALAAIAASRMLRDHRVGSLVTFGAPPSVRPFVAKTLEHLLDSGDCVRVERADPVTILLRCLYRSPGKRVYIMRHGRIIDGAGWHVSLLDRIGCMWDNFVYRVQSAIRGEFRNALGLSSLFSNHSMPGYISAMRKYGGKKR